MAIRKSSCIVSRCHITSRWQTLRLSKMSKSCKVAFRRRITSNDVFHASWRRLFGWLTTRTAGRWISIESMSLLLLRRLICAESMLE